MSIARNQAIRLVAIDIDGTLLDSNGQLHPETMETIEMVRRGGVIVTLATGRSYAMTAPFVKTLALKQPIITHHGAYVVSNNQQPLFKLPMHMESAKQMISDLEAEGFYLKVYIDDQLYVQVATTETVRFSEKYGLGYTEVGMHNLSKLTDHPLKIVILDEPQRIRRAFQILEPWKSRFALLSDVDTDIEIIDRATNKGAALQQVCKMLSIPMQQVMAIGNELNDLEMIDAAGIGVAMSNANPGLKRYADVITKSNDECGVAYILNEYILKSKF